MKALIWCIIFLAIFATFIVLSCIKVSGICSEQEEQRKQEQE